MTVLSAAPRTGAAPTTDRLIEALHVAAGTRPGTPQATEWRHLAYDLETALDALGPQNPQPVAA